MENFDKKISENQILTSEQEKMLEELKKEGNSEKIDVEIERLEKLIKDSSSAILQISYYLSILEGWKREDELRKK